MKVVAILQARMGSTRLPGKVLLEVGGRPLLAYSIERLRNCTKLDDIVLATTENPADDPIAEFGESMGIVVLRGSEDNVLDRYYKAAVIAQATHIVRVTGDCPLLDPVICDQVVTEFFELGCDYYATSSAVAEGLDCEMFSFTALEQAWKEAELSSEQEHVTLFIRNRPEQFVVKTTAAQQDHSMYRVTVDEPEDFTVVKTILEALVPEHGVVFGFELVKEFLDTHPEIVAINSQVVRNEGLLKSLEEDKT